MRASAVGNGPQAASDGDKNTHAEPPVGSCIRERGKRLDDQNGVKSAHRCHSLARWSAAGRSRMKAWWQFPNASRASDFARWTLASCGAATVAWAFVEGDPVSPEKKREAAPGPAASPEEVARWMRRASIEGTAGGTLEAALAQVGPWAAEQTARDNDVPARVPPRA